MLCCTYLCGVSQNQQINENLKSCSFLFFDLYVLQRNVTSRVSTTYTRDKIQQSEQKARRVTKCKSHNQGRDHGWISDCQPRFVQPSHQRENSAHPLRVSRKGYNNISRDSTLSS